MSALVLQHGESGPPGVLGDWAADRGVPLAVHRTDLEPTHARPRAATPSSPPWARRTTRPTRTMPEIAAELALLDEAVDARRPRARAVLRRPDAGQGARRGDRARARAGARLAPDRLRRPERVPEGPWLEWHYDRFTLPPGATELARTPIAVQAFAHGRHLGLQFHPESTIEIVRVWANAERNQVRSGRRGRRRAAGGGRPPREARPAARPTSSSTASGTRARERRSRVAEP